MKFFLAMICCLLTFVLKAQYTQQLRGTVTEQVLQKPLPGATVTIGSHTVTANEEGVFRFTHLPVGVYRLVISNAGYKTHTLENITVNSGKETVLNISLEALVRAEETVTIKAASRKNKPVNDMSLVSARAFTVEETQKYAASVNDPLRMAAAFPGVLAADDGNNNIIIRGNAPTGLLWRMEGMDIPNPNHFAVPGLSGGGISILNSQLLANSDFVTAAFAAEYGNALSGVFDIRLRKGNNEKREYNLQAGVMGISASAEGPFSKKYKGSYLVNYRYSTLSILNKLGLLPDFGATNFQDLSYNIHLPAGKAGTFSVFGFAGKSDQAVLPEKDSLKWDSDFDRYKEKFISNTTMNGVTHTLHLGNKLNIKSGIGLAHTKIAYERSYMENDYSLQKKYTDEFTTRKWTLQSVLNYRFSKKLNMRAGFIAGFIHYRFYQLSAKNDAEPLREVLNTGGNTATQQFFAQTQYKPANDVILSAGLHFLRLAHNNSTSVEPRFSARWNMGRRSSISAGYGLHSQLQTLNLYFSELPDKTMPNRNVGFTKSHHYVLSYTYRLTSALLLKTELYYQQLFRVPVNSGDSGSLSSLNIEYEYITDPLVNKGKGKNYGLEISLERYLQNHFYLMLSNSLYQSKYTAADGVERNTRYNGNYIGTLIAGKEFVSKRKHKIFGVNLKTIYSGGMRTTPVNEAASQLNGYTVFKEKDAFSLQNPAYFRTDLRVSIKWNRKYITSTLSLDIQNVTNRQNVFSQSYDKEKNKVVTNYQTGLIPILNYKIDF